MPANNPISVPRIPTTLSTPRSIQSRSTRGTRARTSSRAPSNSASNEDMMIQLREMLDNRFMDLQQQFAGSIMAPIDLIQHQTSIQPYQQPQSVRRFMTSHNSLVRLPSAGEQVSPTPTYRPPRGFHEGPRVIGLGPIGPALPSIDGGYQAQPAPNWPSTPNTAAESVHDNAGWYSAQPSQQHQPSSQYSGFGGRR